jgi:hypothetical protein
MQRECDKSTAIAEEALQAAASEVSAINDQLDKEVTARETLQNTIRELEHKLVSEKQKNTLSAELIFNRKQWQRDTNNLIVSIQQECNTVFTQSLTRDRTESPRSVTTVNDNTDINNDVKNRIDKNYDKSNTVTQLNDDSCLSRIEHGAGATMIDVAFPIHRTPWKRDGTSTIIAKSTSYNSPLDVSQALDETEALVRSLVTK